ncbi:MAG: uracil-DNA glycosylase family protein [Phycisphaerales bacterium]
MNAHDQLATLVRQHARTAQLLGVDFVPAYGTGGTPLSPAESAEDPATGSMVEPKPERPSTTRTRPEAKPSAPSRSAPAASEAVFMAPARPVTPEAREGRKTKDIQKRLDALRARYEQDAPHKAFENHSHNIVFGEGDPLASIMFIGEAPGEEEDRTGRPFVGRAGQLLDKMIVAMGLARADVYICNVLKTRPPNNATPTIQEAAACEPYLLEQVSIVLPLAIVTLGKSAAQCVLHTTETMTAMRGSWRELVLPDGTGIPVMPTYHPAFLLRSYTPENRQKVWSDLKKVLERVGITPPAKSST